MRLGFIRTHPSTPAPPVSVRSQRYATEKVILILPQSKAHEINELQRENQRFVMTDLV